MTPAAIIFDFDGVVADSEVRANLSLAESLTAAGMPATYDECLRDYYGHNWQETERRIVARYGRALPADFRETHRERARARYMEGFDAVPGVAVFLDALGPLPRAIASSSRAEYIGWALGLFGLGHHFGEHVYSADGWDRGKPFPDIYLAAAKGLGVDPAGCLAIEDSPTGARAAIAAGMAVVGFCGAGHIVDRAGHGEMLREVGVHHVALTFDEVASLIF
ncbi:MULTISPECIES: HAD family phosphatase [unclassified Sphingopyxis]|uniref:HAD family hydrolase n=1 Tax=unclassified Sphingopyxis TaxID=2614943 RepID=UPI0006C4855C|nr:MULTISPECIES: HAD family phosphatase [unclassified Sphingopyxis]USI79132.1 HAD family phosphatase [Sphingopyxis sp. USTB-05]GAO78433.1 putative phosphatase YieH [Sphingopyxis sp. C-1]